jgi:FKBP-type peptidyl-prolyl cis-trans isomerase
VIGTRRGGLALVAGLLLAACGSASDGGDSNEGTDASSEVEAAADSTIAEPETTFEDVGPPPTSPDKPPVSIPDAAPSELQKTVLVEGTGDEAAAGDHVVVDYIGVRSEDGVEFDNSYDREPFIVTLGAGNVIKGWDDGLVGAQQGDRIQLDIPSELAYGETARGDVIRENENLTFVIDVRGVIKPADPTDQPTEPGVPLSEGAAATTYEDLIVGEGTALATGNTAVLRYVNFRGDNGNAIETNWTSEPLPIPFNDGLLPGLLAGMEGMQVGGRRAITIPPEEGFGPEGNPQGGLPAGTDMIFVVDLLDVF